jgi:thiol-disulfide isomerase/thioredoxin
MYLTVPCITMFLCASLQIVMKFSATWCVPCRNAAPLFAELSLKHADLVFVSIDVDELPVTSVLNKFAQCFFCPTFYLCNRPLNLLCFTQELVTEFDIRATPTFIFMRDKKEIDKLVGGNQADLEKKFDPYCQQKDQQPFCLSVEHQNEHGQNT